MSCRRATSPATIVGMGIIYFPHPHCKHVVLCMRFVLEVFVFAMYSARAASNKLGPAVDGAESVVAATLRGTRRPSRLAQLT